jgi:hypothetical protein
MRRIALALGACGALCAPAARAAEQVRISASFSPYRLGAPAAIGLGMSVSAPGGVPSPLTGLVLHYPRDLGIATSGLGTATCAPGALELNGPGGCPRDSIMGAGVALTRFRIGTSIFNEQAQIAILAGPSRDGRLHLLISATGRSPVAARIVMASTLLDGRLAIAVPLVPSLPEGEDVALVAVHATLGGHLTYTERRRGRLVRYTPRGVTIPARCPRGGFRFAASATFLDGSSAGAQLAMACPRHSR